MWIRAFVTSLILGLGFPCGLPAQDLPPTWGQMWRGYSREAREQYVAGYENGWQDGLIAGAGKSPVTKERALLQGRYGLPGHQLCDLVDHFYSDPANDYISFRSALFFSIGKLKGDSNVEEQLRAARKFGLESYDERKQKNNTKPKPLP